MIERSSAPGPIAQAVAAAIAGVADVARLTAGAGVEAATYYAGGKTIGVVVGKDQITVHIVVMELPVARVAERVREAALEVLGALGARHAVDVVVEDVELDQLPDVPRSAMLPPAKARRGTVR